MGIQKSTLEFRSWDDTEYTGSMEFGLASLTNRELYDWRCTLEEGEAKTVYRRQRLDHNLMLLRSEHTSSRRHCCCD